MVRVLLLWAAAIGALLVLTLQVKGAEAGAGAGKPATFTSRDASNIRELCGLAVKSASLTLEQTTAVGQYCQDLLARVSAASEAAAAAAPAPAASKEP